MSFAYHLSWDESIWLSQWIDSSSPSREKSLAYHDIIRYIISISAYRYRNQCIWAYTKQYVAVCCSVLLQCAAVSCSVWQCVAIDHTTSSCNPHDSERKHSRKKTNRQRDIETCTYVRGGLCERKKERGKKREGEGRGGVERREVDIYISGYIFQRTHITYMHMYIYTCTCV